MNVRDYKGGNSFEVVPFNEVDALLFAWIAYFKYERFAAGKNALYGMTLGEIQSVYRIENYFDSRVDKVSGVATAATVLHQMANSQRFSNVRIVDYETVFDDVRVVQFATVTYELPDGVRVVAYRGTDSTVIGWKEDLRLAYQTEVEGQKEAVKYINNSEAGRKYIIVGHSKGGNEALYAFLKMNESKVSDIVGVYNFDGPGFLEDLFNTDRYADNRQKIYNYVPSASIIGMMLNHADDFTVVKSAGFSIMQHSALYWEVDGCRFVVEEKNEWKRDVADQTISGFLDSISIADREFLVETFFSVFGQCGDMTLEDVTQHPVKTVRLLTMKYLMLEPENRYKFRRMLYVLGLSWGISYFTNVGRTEDDDKNPVNKGVKNLLGFLSGGGKKRLE